jgi:hypothetical protein
MHLKEIEPEDMDCMTCIMRSFIKPKVDQKDEIKENAMG